MGSLAHSSDLKSRHYGSYANEYRASKAAVKMLMVQYAGILGREGVRVLGADPGFCATNFTGNPDALRQMGAMEPEAGGQMVASIVRGEGDADAGKVCGLEGSVPVVGHLLHWAL
jgi:NAD(P)-dependent dehydrogenase (short-subunit alcohol dehydrogenase family)